MLLSAQWGSSRYLWTISLPTELYLGHRIYRQSPNYPPAAGEWGMGNDSVTRCRSKAVEARARFTPLALAPVNESHLPVQVAWTYGWRWPGSSVSEVPFCTTRCDCQRIKVVFHSCFLGGLRRSLSTLETTSPALAGDGLFSVYTSVPSTEPALCFAGRERRGGYWGVREEGTRAW